MKRGIYIIKFKILHVPLLLEKKMKMKRMKEEETDNFEDIIYGEKY